MRKRFGALALLAALIITAGCEGSAAPYADVAEAIRSGAVLGENIIIDGLDVSGMSVAAARRALITAREEGFAALVYEIVAGEDCAEVTALELGAKSDVDDVLLKALSLTQYYPSGNRARELTSKLVIDAAAVERAAARLAEALSRAPVDASAAYDASAEGYFRYTDAQDGRTVNAERLADQLTVALGAERSASIEPPLTAIPAGYTLEQAKADTQCIARFFTSFAGGTFGKANRVFNIEKAAGLIDGVTLAPGEEFDMNAILGDRNAENGWKEATGIRDAVYVQEYGGGVCQVSTTLYNAVLMADLTVTDRTHHSWPLGYVDIGRDATISTGGPNFKFKNTGEMPVTIVARTDKEAKTITVSIYGRPLADGMEIRLRSEKVESLPEPETEIIIDTSLAPGAEEVVREPRRGSVSVTYKEYYDAEGKLLRSEQVTRDKYRSIKGITRVGAQASEANTIIVP